MNPPDPYKTREAVGERVDEKERSVNETRAGAAKVLGLKERTSVSFESFSENPTPLWESMGLQDGHFSSEDIEEKAKEFLVQNGILNESDVEDGTVTIKARINQRKLGGEMYDAEYQGEVNIYIDNEYHMYGPAVSEGMQQNSDGFLTGMEMNFGYKYTGDNPPRLQSANIQKINSW